jgi:hypothetical protein
MKGAHSPTACAKTISNYNFVLRRVAGRSGFTVGR